MFESHLKHFHKENSNGIFCIIVLQKAQKSCLIKMAVSQWSHMRHTPPALAGIGHPQYNKLNSVVVKA